MDVSLYVFLPVILFPACGEAHPSSSTNEVTLVSSCSLTTCPRTDAERKWRLFCMYTSPNCPQEDTYYFCGRDPDNQVMAEDCFPRHICDKGSTNAVRVDLGRDKPTVSLQCVQCDEDHIQQSSHDTEMRFESECDDPRMTLALYNKLPTMIRIKERWPYQYDLYACDYKNGYRNIHNISLCDVNTPCLCKKDVTCTDRDKPQLLPNGQCDAPCSKDRDPFNNFTCPREETVSTSPNTPNLIPRAEPNGFSVDRYVSQPTDSKTSLSDGAIIGIVVLLIVVVIFITLIILYRKFPQESRAIVSADGTENLHNRQLTERTINNNETNGNKTVMKGKNITVHYTQYQPLPREDHGTSPVRDAAVGNFPNPDRDVDPALASITPSNNFPSQKMKKLDFTTQHSS